MIELHPNQGLTDAMAAELTRELQGKSTLQDIVRWAFALSPPSDVSHVVVQDEFTHDVVIGWREVFLVFDTT